MFFYYLPFYYVQLESFTCSGRCVIVYGFSLYSHCFFSFPILINDLSDLSIVIIRRALIGTKIYYFSDVKFLVMRRIGWTPQKIWDISVGKVRFRRITTNKLFSILIYKIFCLILPLYFYDHSIFFNSSSLFTMCMPS